MPPALTLTFLFSPTQTADGQLRAEQLSVDHNTSNDEELRRLAKCGLDPANLRRTKRVGTQQNSRSIGDYSIKGGYRDIDIIRYDGVLEKEYRGDNPTK